MERETLSRVAQRYRDEGYDVVVEPQPEQTPPFLANLRPDLIASRGAEHIVVEAKFNRVDVSADSLLTRMAEVIAAQPGWRLDLVVLEQETAFERASQESAEPSDDQLAQILKSAEEMADNGYTPYAYVVACGGLEAAMRRIPEGSDRPGRTSPAQLMRTLYGDGLLTREEFERLRDAYRIRTQVAHGLVPRQVDLESVRFVTATARQLASRERTVVPPG